MKHLATVNPDTFRHFRKERGMSQNDVSLATDGRVHLNTIKRIEKASTHRLITSDNARELAAALKVTTDDLAKAPDELKDVDSQLREIGYRRLALVVDGETALAFQLVERLYGLSVKNQILMAPLFAALLAQGSLQWRRERLAVIQDAVKRMWTEAEGHLSFANATSQVEEGIDYELLSIDMDDIFGQEIGEVAFEVGFDPAKNNPFADYLRMLAKHCPSRVELDIWGLGHWKSPEGLPEYRIAPELLSQITGGDPLAEFALLHHHAKLRDIPNEFKEPESTGKRVEWLISKIPEEARKKEEVRIQEQKYTLGI